MEVPAFSLGTRSLPWVRFPDDEVWLLNADDSEVPVPVIEGFDFHLADELSTGVPTFSQADDEVWSAQASIASFQLVPIVAGFDSYQIQALGLTTIPNAPQASEEVWADIYPDGA